MNDKCFLIHTEWDIGKIEECEIIKETEKTFVISRKGWGNYTIKKSEMTCYSGDIRLTYHEALSRLKDLISFRIVINREKIEKLKNENTSLLEKLVKIESEETE